MEQSEIKISTTPKFILKSGFVNIYNNGDLVANGYVLKTSSEGISIPPPDGKTPYIEKWLLVYKWWKHRS